METTAIVIYISQLTNRAKYVLDFVFTEYFGIDYKVVHPNDFDGTAGISYGVSLEDCIAIPNAEILFESGIRKIDYTAGLWEDLETILPSDGYTIPFDIFSSIFLCLSRYEEYETNERDIHGRFKSPNSFLVKNGWINRPVVDKWLVKFKKVLREKFPELIFVEKKFAYIPTMDVDHAFAYKGRRFSKMILGMMAHPTSIYQRLKVMTGHSKDPFNTFEWWLELHERYAIKTLFFFLMNDNGKHNANVSPDAFILKKLIAHLSVKHAIGIHPSYNAYTENLLSDEQTKLGVKTNLSRQHFLRVHFPAYFNWLIENNIEQDYSIGYADRNGFRAGTTQSFYFFDVLKNQQTGLRLFPFCFTDAVASFYRPSTDEEIQEEINNLIHEVKSVDGCFTVLMHNDSFSDVLKKNNWREIYNNILCSLFGSCA
ncbi:MAG: hypothetical protein K1X55_08110 [Chitinophagales bacterium]|nr:hypothetical protein [Chitinophagales bacterium]